MKNKFENLDLEYEQDKKYLESVGDTPTDEEWEECKAIWRRTWDRIFTRSKTESHGFTRG